MGKTVLIDESNIFEDGNNVNLCDIGIKYDPADEKIIKPFIKKSKTPINILKKRIFNKGVLYKQNEYTFDEKAFQIDNCILCGYWQSEKYFSDVKDDVKNSIKLDDSLNEKNIQVRELIKDTNSISVHIRGGDYLTKKNNRMYGGICDEAYYQRAISYISDRVNDPFYYIFTNDYEYASRMLNSLGLYERYMIIDFNTRKDSYRDMYLMSQCKHNIVANSSFSWWGSYLNNNSDGIVIAPQKWLQLRDEKDIYFDRMVRV